MSRAPLDRDRGDTGRLLWFAVLAWILLLALILTSCATSEVLLDAPEEFWLTGEKLLLALWQDITSILRVVFPIP